LQGLQWVWQYYTQGCNNWQWRYPYTYAPLMQDLASYFLSGSTMPSSSSFSVTISKPLPSHVQLAYVLPISNHAAYITDASYVAWLSENYRELYVDELHDFHWSYCRYFWEAHPVLPTITSDVIEKWSAYSSK
jgi:5'-3' exonuclease